MHRSVAAFIKHLGTERQASTHTLRSYEDDLELYCGYVAECSGEEADPTAADPSRLRRYSAWLSGRGYAPSTIARRLASLRSFFRFLRREGLVAADPAAGLRNPETGKEVTQLAPGRRGDPAAGGHPGRDRRRGYAIVRCWKPYTGGDCA